MKAFLRKIFAELLFALRVNRILLLLIFIVFIGFILRIQGIPEGYFTFAYDAGRDMLKIKNIVVDRKLTLIGPHTGMEGVFQGPGWFYFLSLFFVFTGGDPRGNVYAVISIVILAIILAYIAGQTISKKAGLLFAFILAISPYLIDNSRVPINPRGMILIITLYLVFILKILEGNFKYLLPLSFIIGLGFHFETAFSFFLIPATLIVLFIFTPRFIKDFRNVFLTIASFFLAISPQVVFDLRHNFLMSRAVLSFFIESDRGLGRVEPIYNQIFIRFNQFKSIFYYTFSKDLDNFLFLILNFTLVLSLILFLKMSSQKERKTFLAVFLILFLFFWSYLLYPYPVWDHYLDGIVIIYSFLLSVIFGIISRRKIGKLFLFVFLLLLVFQLTSQLKLTFAERKYESNHPNYLRSELEILEYIYNSAGGKEFNILVFTPPVYDYHYQYLKWWYGKKKNYIPGEEKKGLFYLIMEPDIYRPWAVEGWLKTQIKVGEILERKVFQNGVILEKRFY